MKDSYWAFFGALIWTILAAKNYVEIASGGADGWSVSLFAAGVVFVPFLLRRGVAHTIKENS